MRQLLTLFTIFIFLLSCQNNPSNENLKLDRWSQWVIENELKINNELNLRQAELLKAEPNDSYWVSKSIVVTIYDTTILGTFAKIINKKNTCFLTEYTFFKEPKAKKEIIIIKDDSTTCKMKIDSIFSSINSTKYFNLKRE